MAKQRRSKSRRGAVQSRRKRNNRWIQRALRKHKRGSLHRMLRVPMGKKIPLAKLRRAAKASGLLGQRARLALNLRGFSHKRKRR